MAAEEVVRVDKLVKRYGELCAVDHLDMSVRQGEIFGLLGPNGSGKTTAINCILQLLRYDHGSISVFGQSMTPTSYGLKRRIGVVYSARRYQAALDNIAYGENIVLLYQPS